MHRHEERDCDQEQCANLNKERVSSSDRPKDNEEERVLADRLDGVERVLAERRLDERCTVGQEGVGSEAGGGARDGSDLV